MFETAQERIRAHIDGLLAELEVEIVEFTIQRHGRTIAVQLLVDHENGGITVDECSAINKSVTFVVEEELLLEGDYLIEVSSPGLDRPLKSAQDFRRVLGKMVKFHLKEKLGNKLEHDGRIDEIQAEGVTVAVKEGPLHIPYALIQKAVQII